MDAGDHYSVSGDDEEHAQLPPLHGRVRREYRRHPQFDSRAEEFDSQQSSSFHPFDKENRRFDQHSDKMTATRSKQKTKANPNPKKKAKADKKSAKKDEESDDETEHEPEIADRNAGAFAYIAQLEAKLAAGGGGGKSRYSGELTTEEKRWLNDVRAATKEYAWGKVKFINDERKLTRITGGIFDLWKPKGYEHLKGKALESAKAHWVVNNKELVRVSLTDIRNYVQGQIRDFIVPLMVDGKPVPTPEQVFKCATRDPEMSKEENHWIMEMYWDSLLFKVVGKEYWDPNKRHYSLISTAKRSDGVNLCIHEGTEAILVAIYTNCWERWQYMAECKRKNVKYDRQNSKADTKFIDSNKGQARWGGWNDAGRAYFLETRIKVEEARAQENAQKLEQECLDRLRVIHKIVVSDGEQPKKKSKKRKAAALEEEVIDAGDEL